MVVVPCKGAPKEDNQNNEQPLVLGHENEALPPKDTLAFSPSGPLGHGASNNAAAALAPSTNLLV